MGSTWESYNTRINRPWTINKRLDMLDVDKKEIKEETERLPGVPCIKNKYNYCPECVPPCSMGYVCPWEVGT